MKLETIEGVMNISLDPIGTLTLAAFLLLFGYFLRRKVRFFERFCIPAPVIGGFVFMFINFFCHLSGQVVFKFDTMFQAPFMLAFFTTIGLGASLALLKKGGKLLVIYWLIAGAVSLIQCLVGSGMAIATGIEPVYGIIAGPVALIGGHGGAAAYGVTLEGMGFSQGTLVGMAAATFGLIIGALVGGPLGGRLITKYNLKPDPTESLDQVDLSDINSEVSKPLSYGTTMKNITAMLFAMFLGTIVCEALSGYISQFVDYDISIPTYVGAMFIALIIRNVNEKVKVYEFNYNLIAKMGDVFLGLYLSMALMSLKMWELAELAGPLLIILIMQVVVLALLAYFVVFRLLGKNYDAAVMCSGLMGHGLGATPTAIVNMSAVNEKYGLSRKAMMIVPIVGAFLVDIIYQPLVVTFINFFGK